MSIVNAALIPLKEFQDMHLQVQYGFKPDADILAVLDVASSTKEVSFIRPPFLLLLLIYIFRLHLLKRIKFYNYMIIANR